MKRALILLPVFFLFFLSISFAEEDSFGQVQIKCEAGVEIFLDGIFKGTTTSTLGGFMIKRASVGKHSVKAAKKGYAPKVQEAIVKSGKVTVIEFSGFVKIADAPQDGKENINEQDIPTGDIIITSRPLECKVACKGLAIDSRKSKLRMVNTHSNSSLPEKYLSMRLK